MQHGRGALYVVAVEEEPQLVRGYDEPAEVTQVETHTLTVTGLSPYGTTFQGCAPLGGLAVCSEMSLTSTITASLRE